MNRHQVLDFRLIAFFWYRLSKRINLQMESMIDINFFIKPSQTVQMEGNLEFVQKIPFSHRGYEFRYNQSIMKNIEEEDFESDNIFFFEDILQHYFRRDCKLKIFIDLFIFKYFYLKTRLHTIFSHLPSMAAFQICSQ